MILEVDPSDPTPVYEQIRSQVAVMVATGTLPPGTRLPTIRQLALDLGLAKGTVAKAYEALLREGIVESAGRRGTVVADRRPAPDLDAGRELRHSARGYAVRARQLGVDPETAVDAVRRAMAVLGGSSPADDPVDEPVDGVRGGRAPHGVDSTDR